MQVIISSKSLQVAASLDETNEGMAIVPSMSWSEEYRQDLPDIFDAPGVTRRVVAYLGGCIIPDCTFFTFRIDGLRTEGTPLNPYIWNASKTTLSVDVRQVSSDHPQQLICVYAIYPDDRAVFLNNALNNTIEIPLIDLNMYVDAGVREFLFKITDTTVPYCSGAVLAKCSFHVRLEGECYEMGVTDGQGCVPGSVWRPYPICECGCIVQECSPNKECFDYPVCQCLCKPKPCLPGSIFDYDICDCVVDPCPGLICQSNQSPTRIDGRCYCVDLCEDGSMPLFVKGEWVCEDNLCMPPYPPKPVDIISCRDTIHEHGTRWVLNDKCKWVEEVIPTPECDGEYNPPPPPPPDQPPPPPLTCDGIICPAGQHCEMVDEVPTCADDEVIPEPIDTESPTEFFKFTIDTRQTNTGLDGTDKTFSIPVSNNAFDYNWHIDWGDGSTQTVSGTGAYDNAGITKTYATAGQYQITIRPAGSLDSWFKAFGFSQYITGANQYTNKNKVVSPDSPITIAMYAAPNSTTVGNSVCAYMFTGCNGVNFTLGDGFGFAPEWNNVTTVGSAFCAGMFKECLTLTLLPPNFNLPQSITSVSTSFCNGMFSNCRSLMALPVSFNIPQSIAGKVGGYFCGGMFNDCRSLTALPSSFTIPSMVTGSLYSQSNFCDQMFYNCTHDDFQIPVNFRFPQLSQEEMNKSGTFYLTFGCDFNKTYSRQSIDALTILNGNPLPPYDRRTFFTYDAVQGANRWSDYNNLATQWK